MTIKRKLKSNSLYGNLFKYNTELKCWKMLPDLILFSIFTVYLIMTILFLTTYSYYTVQHTSMQPLLNNYTVDELQEGIWDGVYINTKAEAEVGDVIVIRNEFDADAKTVVKRLIAVGGDKIAIRKVILVDETEKYELLRIPEGNNSPYIMVENYLSNTAVSEGMERVYSNFYNYLSGETDKETISGVTYLVLQDNEIFYLGDNRGNSRDCSEYGPALEENILGRVDVIVLRQQNMIFHIFEYLLGFKNV